MKKIISLLYSVWVNLRLFGLTTAMKLPIVVSVNTKIKIKGKIELPDELSFGMIRLGFGGTVGINGNRKNYFIVDEGASVSFSGRVMVGAGFTIKVNKDATVHLGENISINKNFFLTADRAIVIKENALIGWSVQMIDGNGHKVVYEDTSSELESKKIFVGSDVWIASETCLLGGTSINGNNVVAIRSLVNKTHSSDTLIAGSPAREVKKIISWNV